MSLFSKIVLFSQSTIKHDAAQSVFGQTVDCLEGGQTHCPQPIGRQSAQTCMQRRIEPHLDLIRRSSGRDTLFLVVENYIEARNGSSEDDDDNKDDDDSAAFYDRVAVCAITNGGFSVLYDFDASIAVQVPDQYNAVLAEPDIREPLGLSKTIGERIAECSGAEQAVSKDWFQFVDRDNVDRGAQIAHALGALLRDLRDADHLARHMATYENFPKPGVVFKDMFCLLASSTIKQTFYGRAERIVRQLFSSGGSTHQHFVAGLESRGLLLGEALAARLGLPFVALRKRGKLPRDAERPIRSTPYSTEYSNDVIEVQREHFVHFDARRCVLVDDLIATGGSVCGAIQLLEQCGASVPHILVLEDIEPLRKQWTAALDAVSPLTRVSFLL